MTGSNDDLPKKSGGFAELFAQVEEQDRTPKRKGLSVGDKLEVEIASITSTSVLVDLDGKRHAYFDRVELEGPDGVLTVKIGDRMKAMVVAIDGGEVHLGRSAGRAESSAAVVAAKESGVPIDGKVTGVNKGGLEIDLGGARAFCPLSQIDLRRVEDPASYVGRTIRVRVLEVKEGGRNVLVSRRAVLEEEQRETQQKTLADLEIGKIVRGVVSQIREFGAFVDLGGLQALIPASELTHDRSLSPGDVVNVGDVVEAQVRKIDRDDKGRPQIALSLKALAADPWDGIDVVAPVGKVVSGAVTRTADFGVFVRLASGIEGLLHVSEIGGTKRPADVYPVGKMVHATVLRVDRPGKKIALAPAPEGAELGATISNDGFGVGAIVAGTVDRIETFGVFLQIEGTRGRAGRGLIPNQELGVARGADVRKLFSIGQRLEGVKVVEVLDGKIRLSVRAAKDDEERAQFEGYRAESAASASLGTFADLLKKK